MYSPIHGTGATALSFGKVYTSAMICVVFVRRYNTNVVDDCDQRQ